MFFVFFVIGVSLKGLISEALEKNPKIKAVEQRYFAETYKAGYESSLPPISFGAGLRLGVGPEFELAQKIPYPPRLSKISELGRARANMIKAELELTRWEVIADLKQKYFDLWALHSEKEIYESMKNLLYDLKRASEIRYGVGKEILQAVLRVDIEIARAEERILLISAGVKELEAKINELCGRDPASHLGKPEEKDIIPIRIEDDDIQNLVNLAEKNSPLLSLRSAEVSVFGENLKFSKLSYYPDFTLSLNNMMGLPAFFISVDIPIWFHRDQVNRVREAVSLFTSSQETLESARLKVISDIKTYGELAKSSFELWKLYREKILPYARASYESARSSWMVGSSDFTRVIDSFLLLLMYEVEEKKQIALNRKYVAELEKLIGSELDQEKGGVVK